MFKKKKKNENILISSMYIYSIIIVLLSVAIMVGECIKSTKCRVRKIKIVHILKAYYLYFLRALCSEP